MANFYGSLIGFGAGGEAVVYTIATGGTITTDGNYKVHRFTGDGTFEITTLGADAVIEYLVVAGGGSGAGAPGTYGGGGGGAGGYLAATGFAVTAVSYDIDVGAGGAAVAVGSATTNDGGNSHISHASITDIVATGGGAGTPPVGVDGREGGSGGGVGFGVHAAGSGVAGPPRQGYDGGAGLGNASGSGGGGAGGAGDDVDASDPFGEGGIGLQNDITGTNLYYAGGGGGAYTAGGSSIGGTGTLTSPSTAAPAGPVNTGSGGGGTVESTFASGAGGSGVVIIRYQFQ